MVIGAARFTTLSGGAVIPGRKLAAGGQGEVFAVTREQVFKRYLPATLDGDPSLERRLRVMAGHRPEGWRDSGSGHLTLAWPAEVVLEDGRFTGFLMPAVDVEQTVGLHRVTNPTDRRTATGATAWARAFTWEYLIRTGANLAGATHELHRAGVVIGDFNESNIRAWRQALVTLLDCDSMQITDPASGERFFCPVGRPEFTPPELLNADWRRTVRHPSSDLFALAVHLYQLLLEGEHPFRGVWGGSGEKPPVPELAREGIWAQRDGGLLRPRPAAIGFGLLPDGIAGMFRQAFEDGAIDPAARPTAMQWRDALDGLAGQLRPCDVDRSHRYPGNQDACPWCRHAATVRPLPGIHPARSPAPPRDGASAAPPAAPPASRSGIAGGGHPGTRSRRTTRAGVAIGVILAALIGIGLLVRFSMTSSPGYQPVRTLTEHPDSLATVGTLAFSPSGTTLATGDISGNVDLWDLASGSFTTLAFAPKWSGYDDSVASVAFSPSGTTLAIGASSGSVSLWNPAAPHATRTIFSDSPQLGVHAVAFSPDGQELAIGDKETTTYLVSLTRRRVIATFTSGPAPPYSSFVSSVAFSPDGTMLAAANYNGRTCVWNAATGHPLHVFTAQRALALAFSPDGELLAVGTKGGADVWNLASGKLAASFPGPADGINAVAFSPDGQALAAGDGGDVSTRVWNLATRRLVATLNDPGNDRGISQVNVVAFSPDGGTLATGDASGSSYLWKTSLWKAPVSP